MKDTKYILKGDEIIECDLATWVKWFDTNDRIIKRTDLGEAVVSTVFLGMDCSSLEDSGSPVLFETRIFGGSYDGRTRRYSTKKLALEDHDQIVKMIEEVKTFTYTFSGNAGKICPLIIDDSEEDEIYCVINERKCLGDLVKRPEWCVLKETTKAPVQSIEEVGAEIERSHEEMVERWSDSIVRLKGLFKEMKKAAAAWDPKQ